LVGVEGSIQGLTGYNNFVLNLGIGYESRGAAATGYFQQAVAYTPNVMRENYIDLDASFCSNWFQLGIVVGFPLNWHLTLNNVFFSSMEWNLSNADMTTTVGIFAAGIFTVSEWTSGKLIFIARLDIDDFGPSITQTNGIISLMTPSGYRLPPYSPEFAGILIARVGLSYEFSVWSGAR
jgi:hypothetical protein